MTTMTSLKPAKKPSLGKDRKEYHVTCIHDKEQTNTDPDTFFCTLFLIMLHNEVTQFIILRFSQALGADVRQILSREDML